MERLRRILKVVAFGLLVAAVADQLRRPPEERTWEGTVVGTEKVPIHVPQLANRASRLEREVAYSLAIQKLSVTGSTLMPP